MGFLRSIGGYANVRVSLRVFRALLYPFAARPNTRFLSNNDATYRKSKNIIFFKLRPCNAVNEQPFQVASIRPILYLGP